MTSDTQTRTYTNSVGPWFRHDRRSVFTSLVVEVVGENTVTDRVSVVVS